MNSQNHLFLLLSLVIGVMTMSCNKNNQVAKNLDGEWSVDQIYTGSGGVAQSDLPRSISFTGCKVSDENCDGEYVASDGSTFSFVYDITEDGQTFTWGTDEKNASGSTQAFSEMETYAGVWEIKEHSDSKFTIISTECNGCGGSEYEIRMSK